MGSGSISRRKMNKRNKMYINFLETKQMIQCQCTNELVNETAYEIPKCDIKKTIRFSFQYILLTNVLFYRCT